MRYALDYTHILGDEFSPYELLCLLGRKGYNYIVNCQRDMLEKQRRAEESKAREAIQDLENIL